MTTRREIAAEGQRAGVEAPALLIVGEVVARG
jgi:hypothetical protein